MIRRCFLAVCLVLSILSVAAAPVAAAIMGGNILCDTAIADATHHEAGHASAAHAAHMPNHAAHMTGGTSHHGDPDIAAPAEKSSLHFCEHCTVTSAALDTPKGATGTTPTAKLRAWTDGNLTEVNHPDGLRRPPRG